MAEESATREEVNGRHLALLEQIVDKARSEPEWKEKMISDPSAALKEAHLLPDDFDPATAEVVGQTAVEYAVMLALIRILARD